MDNELFRSSEDSVVIDSGFEFTQPGIHFGDLIRLEANGDIFIRGELCENNIEVLNALKSFLGLSTN